MNSIYTKVSENRWKNSNKRLSDPIRNELWKKTKPVWIIILCQSVNRQKFPKTKTNCVVTARMFETVGWKENLIWEINHRSSPWLSTVCAICMCTRTSSYRVWFDQGSPPLIRTNGRKRTRISEKWDVFAFDNCGRTHHLYHLSAVKSEQPVHWN